MAVNFNACDLLQDFSNSGYPGHAFIKKLAIITAIQHSGLNTITRGKDARGEGLVVFFRALAQGSEADIKTQSDGS